MRVYLTGRAATRGFRLGSVKNYIRTQFGLVNNGASTFKWSVPLTPLFAGPGSRGGDAVLQRLLSANRWIRAAEPG